MVDEPVLSKIEIELFEDTCVFMRSQYLHYKILFDNQQLLKKIAPTFFGDLNSVFIEHLILQICKITDPIKSFGRYNLTVPFLVSKSSKISGTEDESLLIDLCKGLLDFREKILPARNKIISHVDLETIRNGEVLGAVDQKYWDKFWQDLQNFIRILHKHYIDSDVEFYLNGVGGLTDGQYLIRALEMSSFIQSH